MELGLCHIPYNLNKGVMFRRCDLDLIGLFDYFVPSGYLCPINLTLNRPLVVSELSKVSSKINYIYGHSLIPCHKSLLSPELGGTFRKFYNLETCVVKDRKLNHIKFMLNSFPYIKEWTVTLENLDGSGNIRDHNWVKYLEYIKLNHPDLRLNTSEVLGTCINRWELWVKSHRWVESFYDSLALQVHLTPLDLKSYIPVLRYVLDNSPIPVFFSEVGIWANYRNHTYWDDPQVYDQSIALVNEIINEAKPNRFCWWSMYAGRGHSLPGNITNVPLFTRIAEECDTGITFKPTPLFEHLRLLKYLV